MYKLTNIKYFNSGFRALGKHPDGRVFISKPNSEGILYDMDKNGNIGTAYYNFIANSGFTSNINQILILNNGIMLVTGNTANGHVIMRSTDTTYTNFVYVLTLTTESYIFDKGWATNEDDSIILAVEYTVADRNDVPSLNVYRSTDRGLTWTVSHAFTRIVGAPDWIRHAHFVMYDKYDNNFVIGVGDSNDESVMYRTLNGTNLEVLGRGSQQWRSVSVTFTPDYIYWGMDGFDADDKSYMFRLNKTTLEQELLSQAHSLMYLIETIGLGTREVMVVSNAVETHQNFLDKALDMRVHLYLCADGLNFIDTHSWARNTDTALYSRADNIIDLGDGKILMSMRAIVSENGTKYSYVIVIADLAETSEPKLKIRGRNGLESLPLFTFDKIVDDRLRVFVNGVTRYLELVDVTDVNASSVKISIGGKTKAIKKI